MTAPTRVVVYCQYSSGIGHLVRSAAIVRALVGRGHDVTFVVGGRPFVDSPAHGPWRTVQLPPIQRVDGALVPADGRADVARVWATRAETLCGVITETRPHVFVIEHFPVSRRSHRAELMGAIAAAGDARIVASVRDVVLPSSADTPPEAELIATLNDHFHMLLVHGDPAVTRIDDQVGWVGAVAIPIVYTGYVASRDAPMAHVDSAAISPYVLLSAGGGNETRELALPVIDAWQDARRLVVFAGPLASDALVAELERHAAGRNVIVRRATDDLAGWMATAELSISRAGYNTCVDVLASGARALLVPSAKMSDQRLRAERFAALDLATTLGPEDLVNLPAVIASADRRAPPKLSPRLDGATRSAAVIEALVGAPGQ